MATRSARHSLPRLAICLASNLILVPVIQRLSGTKFQDTFGDSEVAHPGPIWRPPQCHIGKILPHLGHSRHFAAHFSASPLAPAPLPGAGASEANAPVTVATFPLPAPRSLTCRSEGLAAPLGQAPDPEVSGENHAARPRRPRFPGAPRCPPTPRRGSAPGNGAARPRGRRAQPAAVLLSATARGQALAPQLRGGGRRLAPPSARHSREVSARGMGTGVGPPGGGAEGGGGGRAAPAAPGPALRALSACLAGQAARARRLCQRAPPKQRA